MYELSRLMLIGAILTIALCVVIVGAAMGKAFFIGAGALLLVVAYAKWAQIGLSAYGTARFANAEDLRSAGMLGAKTGLIIGRVMDSGKPPFFKAVQGLFDSTKEAKEACEGLLEAVQVGPKPETNPALVRMPKAVHTAVFAPTGVGKGVSCVVPFNENSNWQQHGRKLLKPEPDVFQRRGAGRAGAEAGVEEGTARCLRRGLGHRVDRADQGRGPARLQGVAVLRGRAEGVVRGDTAAKMGVAHAAKHCCYAGMSRKSDTAGCRIGFCIGFLALRQSGQVKNLKNRALRAENLAN